jgi:hypothetical protein
VRGEFFDDVRLFFSPSNQVVRSGMGWLSFLDFFICFSSVAWFEEEVLFFPWVC